MLNQLFERIIPGGVFIGVGVALGATFSESLRPAAKEMLKYGMTAAERIQELTAEAYERSQDLVAEARHEQQQEARTANGSGPTSRRRKAAATRRARGAGSPVRRRATVTVVPAAGNPDKG